MICKTINGMQEKYFANDFSQKVRCLKAEEYAMITRTTDPKLNCKGVFIEEVVIYERLESVVTA